jgi:hypothetical protein
VEFIYFCDTHCNKLRRFFPNDHISVTRNEIIKPLKYATQHTIPNVIFGGDLSDTPFLSQAYFKMLVNLFLEYKHLKFWLMTGNHDYEDQDSHALQFIELCVTLGILTNVRVITQPEVIIIGKVPCNFSPFPHEAFEYKKPCINFGHMEAKGSVRDNFSRVKKGRVFSRDHQFTVLAHIHKNQVVEDRVIHPGALYQMTFGEQLPKYFLYGNFRVKNATLKHEYRFIQTTPDFELIKMNIETPEDFKKISGTASKFYTLHVASGLTVPKNLTTKYPNIMDIKGMKDGDYLSVFDRSASEDMYEGSDVVKDLLCDPMWGLLLFLKKEGLDKIQRKRAIRMVEKVLALI